MELHGCVRDGVVVLKDGARLPEGAEVTVSYDERAGDPPAAERKRIEVPLVRTGEPGTVSLSGDRIAELLGEVDVPPRR